MACRGVGPKVADCVALFSLDSPGTVPVDTHVWDIAMRDMDPSLSACKSLTPTVYDRVGELFRQRYGAHAGWAHSLLFAAELPQFMPRLPEELQHEISDFKKERRAMRMEAKAKKGREGEASDSEGGDDPLSLKSDSREGDGASNALKREGGVSKLSKGIKRKDRVATKPPKSVKREDEEVPKSSRAIQRKDGSVSTSVQSMKRVDEKDSKSPKSLKQEDGEVTKSSKSVGPEDGEVLKMEEATTQAHNVPTTPATRRKRRSRQAVPRSLSPRKAFESSLDAGGGDDRDDDRWEQVG